MTFLTILGVMEISSFRLALEGKTGKLEKFLANNFALSNAEDNTSGPLNRGAVADLPLLRRNAISNLPRVLRAKLLGSNGVSCFSSICKFGSFKNPFAMITILPELYFRFRRFILLVQIKKVISMNYGSSTENHVDE